MDFAVIADHRVKLKELKKRNKYLDLVRELKKKTMEHENDHDTNSNRCARYSYQKIGRGIGGIGNKRTSGDHSNYIIKIGQNTEKSPGDTTGRQSINDAMENSQMSKIRIIKNNNDKWMQQISIKRIQD